MPQVPPGNVTGLYYIIVAGLPWQCSWQKLKDFARNHQTNGTYIDIDHTQVYLDSTDGWVRVKGKCNFLLALAHLDGGVFENRSLIADGRNETEWGHLRDSTSFMAEGQSFLPRQHHCNESLSATYDSPPPSSVSPQQQMVQVSPWISAYSTDTRSSEYSLQSAVSNYSPLPPVFSSGSYVQQPTPIYGTVPSLLLLQPSVDYFASPDPSGIFYSRDMAMGTQVYIPPTAYPCVIPVPFVECLKPVPATSNGPQSRFQTSVVKTEARKIIITHVPHTTTFTELQELLNIIVSTAVADLLVSSAGNASQALQSLEIATHSDGKPRGHAFALFESHHIAKYVVGVLDGYICHGRPLKARITKEGAEPSRRHTTRPRESLLLSPPSEDEQVGQPPCHMEGNPRSSIPLSVNQTMNGVMERSNRGDRPVEALGRREVPSTAPLVVDGSSAGRKHGSKSL